MGLWDWYRSRGECGVKCLVKNFSPANEFDRITVRDLAHAHENQDRDRRLGVAVSCLHEPDPPPTGLRAPLYPGRDPVSHIASYSHPHPHIHASRSRTTRPFPFHAPRMSFVVRYCGFSQCRKKKTDHTSNGSNRILYIIYNGIFFFSFTLPKVVVMVIDVQCRFPRTPTLRPDSI